MVACAFIPDCAYRYDDLVLGCRLVKDSAASEDDKLFRAKGDDFLQTGDAGRSAGP